MTSTTDEETILKADALGRVRMREEKRELILDCFEESGVTGQAFAKHIGIKYPTFASWIQKCRRERGECRALEGSVGESSISLFEAVVEQLSVSSPCSLELVSVGGTRIRLKRSEQIPQFAPAAMAKSKSTKRGVVVSVVATRPTTLIAANRIDKSIRHGT